ncbi:MAG: S9 family peptidase, partial [Nannocystaceae bacterium]
MVVSASTSATVDATMMYSALYTIATDKPSLTPLTKTEGKLGRAAWSPDGAQIAFLGARDIHDSTAGTLFIVPSSGGEARALTADIEGTGQWIGWRDASTIVLSSHERTESTVRLVDARRGTSKLLVEDGPTCRALSLAADGERYACSGSRPTHPPEVFLGTMKRGAVTRMTVTNPELERTILGTQRVYRWTAKDGTELQGVLILPTKFEPGTRYPLAVLPHGGPEGVSLNGWNTRATYPAQIFASQGYVVFEPNYRGSSGRGTSFAVADQQDLGGLEFEDVLSGIDALVAEGLVDKDRVGMGGWSYGGYFSGLAATRWTNRFKATVIAAAVTDWMSFTGTTEIEHENSLVHWKLWPYDEPQKVWDRSPMGHTTNSQTASLIVHGLADTRVPPSQSTELYRALKHAGAPVELVMYPREPHGLRENVHQLDFVERFVGWFNRYVRDTP